MKFELDATDALKEDGETPGGEDIPGVADRISALEMLLSGRRSAPG